MSARMNPELCTVCGQLLDSATGLGDNQQPNLGDISMCLYCGDLKIFDENMKRQEALESELSEVPPYQMFIARKLQAMFEDGTLQRPDSGALRH